METDCSPIRAHDGQVVAALEISGPADRYTPETRTIWIEAATAAAGGISSALGYRPPADGWPPAEVP